MSTVDLTPSARADLVEIEAFVSRDSPLAARCVVVRLQEALQRLADMPGIGHRRPDIRDDRARFLAVYSYLIVYHPDMQPLQILRVVHGSRDVPRAIETHGS